MNEKDDWTNELVNLLGWRNEIIKKWRNKEMKKWKN